MRHQFLEGYFSFRGWSKPVYYPINALHKHECGAKMAETFATTFGAGQSSTGLFTNTPIAGPQYTGTSLTSGAQEITVTGAIDLPGSTVTIDANTANLVGTGLTGTYLGFSLPQGAVEPIYYFSVTGGNLQTPVAISVTNGTISTLNVASSVDTSAVTAPDSPTIVCFVTGTKIGTNRGEIAVEDLQVGDMAVTASGALRPITWIGSREIEAGRGSLPFHQQPVRVQAGAFGQSLPTRDLFLSPGHPVLVGADADNEGGVLVPVMCLINGTTITREPRTGVTYWHVELDSHDILLAEGLPAESYIDGGDRAFFAQASDHALHNPDFVAPGWNGRCRPVAVDGAVVEAERMRLDTVFATVLSGPCAWDAAERFEWLAA
ncbi:MAG: Hint domain-containing protein [Methylorubrum populi]